MFSAATSLHILNWRWQMDDVRVYVKLHKPYGGGESFTGLLLSGTAPLMSHNLLVLCASFVFVC